MKKVLPAPLGILLILTLISFTDSPNPMIGRWQTRLPTGVVLGAVFRSDSSYDGFANGKSFVSGKYYVRQDTIAIADGGCGLAYYGTYKFHFFANDSVRVTAIQDACGGRQGGSDGLAMGRVKATKP